MLDENTPLVGVPAVAQHNPAASVRYYFALVSRELAGPVGSVSSALSFPSTPSQVRVLVRVASLLQCICKSNVLSYIA